MRLKNRKRYWGIAALIVFVIAAGGFIYWQLSETQQFKKQAAQEAKRLERLEGNDKPVDKTFSPGEIGEKRAEADKTNRVVFHIDELPNQGNELRKRKGTNPQTGVPETVKQEERTQSDTGVSPYGFGPYPEIPADFPFPVEWEFPGSDADHELMARVAIKLWNQGIETWGVTMEEDGLVYPNYIDTVYIRWGETTDDDNNPIQYITDLGGYPAACLRIEENNIARLGERGPMTAADIPSDVTVKLYDEAGIDPYTFLGLPK